MSPHPNHELQPPDDLPDHECWVDQNRAAIWVAFENLGTTDALTIAQEVARAYIDGEPLHEENDQ